ncbi:hypothetical protein DYB28_000040, partial [Aphanomyces astaci]
RLLDDQALKIVLDDAATSGNGNANPRNNNSSQRRHNSNDGNNVRQGVFGTALDDNDEPRFNVTFEFVHARSVL